MPSVGRKFLLAGKGGLNLTHSEPFDVFASRYGARRPQIEPLLRKFDAQALRAWAQGLGVETFVGTSGRVFPAEMKAAPLLRAWLHRLRAAGVQFHMRHRCRRLGRGRRTCASTRRRASRAVQADAVVLALGGASWPRLGSDGAWVPLLEQRGVAVAPLAAGQLRLRRAGRLERILRVAFRRPAIQVGGDPVSATFTARANSSPRRRASKAASSTRRRRMLRDEIQAARHRHVRAGPAAGAGAPSRCSPRWRIRAGRARWPATSRAAWAWTASSSRCCTNCCPRRTCTTRTRLAAAIKALPVTVAAPRPIEEAISTAGGVRFEALDDNLMLRDVPGVFCAGEMLDWEAPTGGYLLTACFATGTSRGAGRAATAWRGAGVRTWCGSRSSACRRCGAASPARRFPAAGR